MATGNPTLLNPSAPWVRSLGPNAPVIVASARAHGVDPWVALAVAHGEGGFGKPTPDGDNHTSFGPYQLHSGGALPPQYWNNPAAARAWANSPQGIDYAMARIAQVSRGRTGQAAIAAAVQDFERPAQPGPEITRDTQYYNALHAGRLSHPLSGPGRDPSAGLGGAQATQGSKPPGVSGKVVPNIFSQCKVIGAGPGGGLPVIGGAVGTFTGFLTGQSQGGILCYVTGMAKVTFMGLIGAAMLGGGFYLMLPRGGQAKVQRLTFGTAGTVASLVPGGAAAKGGVKAAGRRLTPKTSVAGQRRQAATAQSESAAKQTKHRESVQRADLRFKRARARTETAKARNMEYKTPANRMSLSRETEDSISRAQKTGSSRRPDRVG